MPERVLVFHVTAWSPNCNLHIAQRFTVEEMAPTIENYQQCVEELEAINASLRNQLLEAGLRPVGGESATEHQVLGFENYAHWETELGRTDFRFGQFGENFTVEGMLDDEIQVGDRFRIGTAVFEVTQPRVPCYKLGIKMQTEGFYSRLLQSGRPGFYFRLYPGLPTNEKR